MNFGYCNVQDINTVEQQAIKELKSIVIDIVILSGTKKIGTGTKYEGDYLFLYSASGVKKDSRAKAGVGIMIHKKYRRATRIKY